MSDPADRSHGGNPRTRGTFSRTESEASSLAAVEWPAHEHVRVPWSQSVRGGTREDRTFSEVTVALPPHIADLDFHPAMPLVLAMEKAVAEIAATDEAIGPGMRSIGQFLIRTESISSSKIEHEEADMASYARALSGNRSNASASSMVAATKALTEMVDAAGFAGLITVEQILNAHRVLMADDSLDAQYAGMLRPMQNWIGGSDYSPRGAVHVPPPPETVADYLRDLVAYCNRDDIPVLIQASIAHAQFESIHPFTDGNGRIGRALINSILRRRGLTLHSVVPIASALVAERSRYFREVNEYRNGEVSLFAMSLSRAASIAAAESRVSAKRLAELPVRWAQAVAPRKNSATDALLAGLLDRPVFTAEEAEGITHAEQSSLYAAITRLEEEGVLQEITGRKRNRVWAVSEIMAELDELNKNIGIRVAACVRLLG